MSLHTMQEQMTPREREEFEQEKVAAAIQSEYNLKIKEMDLELARLQAKWSSWLEIPKTILLLPVRILFGFAYIVAVARKHEPSENFWKFIK